MAQIGQNDLVLQVACGNGRADLEIAQGSSDSRIVHAPGFIVIPQA